MSKYLLELGVEELPWGLIDSLLSQIKTNLENNLKEENVSFSNIITNYTPRRLVFVINDISEIQPTITKKIQGPPEKIAFDSEGKPTLALSSFVKKNDVDISEIKTETLDNGEKKIFVEKTIQGKNISEILPAILPDCVLKIQGSHFMRWAELDERFSRPIRWIVSLFDNKHIPVEICNIKSSTVSRAHRFAKEKTVNITSVDDYEKLLEEHNVIIDAQKRKELIIQKTKELANSIGAKVVIKNELLQEVTNIVEWVNPVLGEFDKKYLEVPSEVIVTVMATHQRYFPLYDSNNKLMNYFITVANYLGEDTSNIKNGNERVIKARLDDAIFFYNEDTKHKLDTKIEALKGMTFQKGLGTLYDKVQRMVSLSSYIAEELKLDNQTKSDIERAALLAKADLTTSLVFEFTELQGVIGSHYALLSGEKENISRAIEEHYYPLVSDGDLPSDIIGQIVSIADKIDTICAVFALNKIPTGSNDPLAVRRAAIGILQIIMQKKLNINLMDLIDKTIEKFNIEIKDKAKLKSMIIEFIIQRLKGILGAKYEQNYIDAVLSSKCSLCDLNDTVNRLEILYKLKTDSEFEKILTSQNRVYKLLKNFDEKSFNIDRTYFKENIEEKLFDKLNIAKNIENYDDLIKNYIELSPVLEEFFEKVMVNDKDEKIKNNRLSLLFLTNNIYLKLADFSKI